MATKGGQPGNTNATKSKRWTEAIDKALKQFADKKRKIEMGQALDRIAHNVVKEAIDGDWWAVAEIGNRLDGKPAQSLEISGEVNSGRQLSDEQILDRLERLERIRAAAGIADPPEGSTDPAGVH